jgi:hypothetical protein
MAERGRRPGFTMSDEHRVKIRNSNILNALIEHVEGVREMSSTQVTAGLGLLRKIMPDLAAAADSDNQGQLRSMKAMSDDELEAIAASGSAGSSEETPSPSQLN